MPYSILTKKKKNTSGKYSCLRKTLTDLENEIMVAGGWGKDRKTILKNNGQIFTKLDENYIKKIHPRNLTNI